MHKRLFNEAILKFTITPVGPILIKAGEEPADPTKPDMSFVRTTQNGRKTVYLPGSSLKGVLRAHCERLARTVDTEQRRERYKKPLSCNPALPFQDAGTDYRKPNYQCSRALNDVSPSDAHKRSCFLCQLFGNTSLASHFRITDALPEDPDKICCEERNGVAIDRIFGSVAVGPFNYETVTAGDFKTTLYVKNFTLAQLGLLFLAVRDIQSERVRVGFAKSRGLGVVTAKVRELTLRYPLGDALRLSDGKEIDKSKLYGVGAFVSEGDGYGYPKSDEIALPNAYGYAPDGWLGVEVKPPSRDGDGVEWHSLARECVPKWKESVQDGD